MTSTQPSPYSKPCTLCSTPRDVLVRCQTDASGTWHFVCPGNCWRDVSGGRVDGDEDHPWYRYGGMWKNKHEGVSAKKKKSKKSKSKGEAGEGIEEWVGGGGDGKDEDDGGEASGKRYTKNDTVVWEGRVWVCRKSHWASGVQRTPDAAIGLWKEDSGQLS